MKKTIVKSPKTVAERNALITAALAAAKSKKPSAKEATKAALVKASPTFAKAAKAGKVTLAQSKKIAAELQNPKPSAAEKLADQAEKGTIPLSTMVTSDIILRKSSIQSPCQIVWEVASEMAAKGGYTRKQVIEACMSRGVAYYTARTQYQQWKAAGDNDKKAAAKSAK